jgi:hypothetical protein
MTRAPCCSDRGRTRCVDRPDAAGPEPAGRPARPDARAGASSVRLWPDVDVMAAAPAGTNRIEPVMEGCGS